MTNHIFKCPGCGCEITMDTDKVKLITEGTILSMLNTPEKKMAPVMCPNCPSTTVFTILFDGDGNIIEVEEENKNE